MGFYFKIKPKFFCPRNVRLADCRSTGPVDRRAQNVYAAKLGRPVNRDSLQPESSALWKASGRPGGRPGREHCSLFPDSVDRAVDRPESRCSLDLARSTGRSTDGLNGHFFDSWPVDRKANLGLFSANGQILLGVIYTPFEGCFV